DGGFEQRAAAFAPGESVWAPDEGALQQVCDSRASTRLGRDGWLFPVVEDGEPVGVLAVRGARVETSSLAVAVRIAGLGLTGMRQYRKQTMLSSTDGLTGLANHRHFQQVLSVALAQAYLANEPLTLVLLDIDKFKNVNDTYGHLFGDLVLREIAYLLRRELPPDSVPTRYGGEEMAVVLRGADALSAPEIAERLRRVIEAHQVFDYASGTRLSVTVSLGVALYQLGQGKSRLVARADEALYTSKREGRNRVTVAVPEESTSHLFPS
ncbi:MAG TPA: GGDEF domain-containing protein, partial [Symbiobacteriaceae bacterium]|nr:GGDEF domain-containing protein [Symbiobacteriaceae bacterium]